MSGDGSSEVAPAPALDRLSVDGLIGWLNQRRIEQPQAALSELVGRHRLPAATLVELVAIDLIRQRRRQLPLKVEDYLKQFPKLGQSDADVLDLIDAEMCVRRELGQCCDVETFVKRFPDFANEIRQLFFLQQEPVSTGDEGAPCKPNETLPLEPSDDADSSEPFLIARELSVVETIRRPAINRPVPETDDSIDVPIPIAPPAWMVGARCTATAICPGGRYWLVKGRDAEHHEAVAMKILPMPSTIGRQERTRILDLCEISSSVTHPVWLAPRIAAINNGHLAVVRQWIFGNPLDSMVLSVTDSDHLPRLVRLAFALSAAHRLGATHGGVHRGNLTLDHDGELHLIDVVSSVAGWSHYLALWNNDLSATLPARITIDAIGLCRLLADEALRLQRPELLEALASLQRQIDLGRADSCLQIGEAVQAYLDGTDGRKKWSFWK